MSEGEWVKCPLCGWHWKRTHTGRHAMEKGQLKPAKGEFTFDKGDPESDAFVSIRQTPGGRGNPESFKEIEKIKLLEAKNIPEYKTLMDSLKMKIEKIKEILK